ncbi:MAG: GNAT family N-acetyltransferase [Muribaculaceae bacterium]|nr:GNAT family N-acetyltransferase [Muribaculaceae bacterium]
MNDADYKNMSAFSCGVDELDNFFRREVRECVEHHYLSAYCAVLNSGELVAAFALMNDALMIADETAKEDFIDDLKIEIDSEEIVSFFDRQSAYPAINISHLGVQSEYQHKGIGTAIVDLVAGTFSIYNQAGCQFITVDAINCSETIKFYHSNGFSIQTQKDIYSPTRRMYRIL